MKVIVCEGDSCFLEVEGIVISCVYPGMVRVFFDCLLY